MFLNEYFKNFKKYFIYQKKLNLILIKIHQLIILNSFFFQNKNLSFIILNQKDIFLIIFFTIYQPYQVFNFLLIP